MLGIPTVIDRLIQQAMHQVMSPVWETGFSEHSYGFRPGRGAHGAVEAARAHVEAGHRWVTDLDLEKFFDRVNHDVLMARVARKFSDPRVLGLVRRYLQSGVMIGGLIEQRVEGTPQGGPLSPLLSNILLDDLDKELERRRHRFCRYADDCNIYVKSRRAGERVLASVAAFLRDRLKLKVNASKSAVRRPWESKFLGYSMTVTRRPRLKVAEQSVQRLRAKVRALLPRGRGKRMEEFIAKDLNPLLRGWANYYRKTEVRGILEELDRWVRRRLRCILWRSWKRARTRARRLIAGGVAAEQAWACAYNGRGPWHHAGSQAMNTACPNALFTRMGLVSLTQIIVQPRA